MNERLFSILASMASSFSEPISNYGEPILGIVPKRICLLIFIQAFYPVEHRHNPICDLRDISIPIDYKRYIEIVSVLSDYRSRH